MQQLQPTTGSICFVKTDRLKRGLQSMGSSDYPMGEIISGENSREVDEEAARQCGHALLQNTMDKELNAATVLTEFSDKNRSV